jgi:hypothetical protein
MLREFAYCVFQLEAGLREIADKDTTGDYLEEVHSKVDTIHSELHALATLAPSIVDRQLSSKDDWGKKSRHFSVSSSNRLLHWEIEQLQQNT